MHRDSVGSEQAMRPGEVNWMTAGRGITHSERFERARAEGGALHAVQAWVALPDEHEETEPGFANDKTATCRRSARRDRGRGSWPGRPSARGRGVKTHSPLFYVHWRLEAGARAELPAEYAERAVYVVSGSVELEGQRFAAGRLLVFAPGRRPRSAPRRPRR